jgi:tRNA pseudouridine(38-40) synthase
VQGINQHLPESVRSLAVQRVNKGFNARERCGTRTYHYFLPAAALDLSGDGEPCSR